MSSSTSHLIDFPLFFIEPPSWFLLLPLLLPLFSHLMFGCALHFCFAIDLWYCYIKLFLFVASFAHFSAVSFPLIPTWDGTNAMLSPIIWILYIVCCISISLTNLVCCLNGCTWIFLRDTNPVSLRERRWCPPGDSYPLSLSISSQYPHPGLYHATFPTPLWWGGAL